jgi:hypothetical protein
MVVTEKKACIKAYCSMDCGNNIIEIEYCCPEMKQEICEAIDRLVASHGYPPEEFEMFTEEFDEECGLVCAEFYHDDMHRDGAVFFNELMTLLNVSYCEK